MMEFNDPFGAHRNVGIPVEGRTWSDREVTEDDLAGVIFLDCTFENVRFERTNLLQTTFLKSRFDDCVFSACDIRETRWVECTGRGMTVVPDQGGQFADAIWTQVRFGKIEIQRYGHQLVFAECEFERMQFDGAGCAQQTPTFSGCTFGALLAENADWKDGTAVGLDLSVCRFDGALLERCSFIESKGRGLDLSGVSFLSCNLFRSDFSEAQLRRAEKSIFAECVLHGTDFEEAVLNGALFVSVQAERARFDRSQLEGALFPHAELSEASFEGASAPHSIWTDANLKDAKLMRLNAPSSIFRNASFAGAEVEGALLSDADLHGVEESLAGADLRGARGTIDWRAEREAEARNSLEPGGAGGPPPRMKQP